MSNSTKLFEFTEIELRNNKDWIKFEIEETTTLKQKVVFMLVPLKDQEINNKNTDTFKLFNNSENLIKALNNFIKAVDTENGNSYTIHVSSHNEGKQTIIINFPGKNLDLQHYILNDGTGLITFTIPTTSASTYIKELSIKRKSTTGELIDKFKFEQDENE